MGLDLYQLAGQTMTMDSSRIRPFADEVRSVNLKASTRLENGSARTLNYRPGLRSGWLVGSEIVFATCNTNICVLKLTPNSQNLFCFIGYLTFSLVLLERTRKTDMQQISGPSEWPSYLMSDWAKLA